MPTLRTALPTDAPALGHIQVTSWRSAFRGIAPDDYLDHQVSAGNQTEDWKEIIPDAEQIVIVAEVENKLSATPGHIAKTIPPSHGTRN